MISDVDHSSHDIEVEMPHVTLYYFRTFCNHQKGERSTRVFDRFSHPLFIRVTNRAVLLLLKNKYINIMES
jgi:hypothetical protein